jgi:hypothetical protein
MNSALVSLKSRKEEESLSFDSAEVPTDGIFVPKGYCFIIETMDKVRKINFAYSKALSSENFRNLLHVALFNNFISC